MNINFFTNLFAFQSVYTLSLTYIFTQRKELCCHIIIGRKIYLKYTLLSVCTDHILKTYLCLRKPWLHKSYLEKTYLVQNLYLDIVYMYGKFLNCKDWVYVLFVFLNDLQYLIGVLKCFGSGGWNFLIDVC